LIAASSKKELSPASNRRARPLAGRMMKGAKYEISRARMPLRCLRAAARIGRVRREKPSPRIRANVRVRR
jgi:hypothetical protein